MFRFVRFSSRLWCSTIVLFDLRYCSDHAENGYKAFCQRKLLQSEGIEPQLVRTYPPSLLETKAIKKCASTAIETCFIDGIIVNSPL